MRLGDWGCTQNVIVHCSVPQPSYGSLHPSLTDTQCRPGPRPLLGIHTQYKALIVIIPLLIEQSKLSENCRKHSEKLQETEWETAKNWVRNCRKQSKKLQKKISKKLKKKKLSEKLQKTQWETEKHRVRNCRKHSEKLNTKNWVRKCRKPSEKLKNWVRNCRNPVWN